jgi:predicted metal-dependent hydrolase
MSTLTVRKLGIDLSRGFGRHWLGGDAYRTQLFNALSMSFPIGEQMFIDSVRAVPQESLADPLLRAAVADFIGQEASHRFVHIQYNAHLARQGLGYTREPAMLRRVQFISGLDVRSRLAITCALEHYTAILADGVLRHDAWLADAEPAMRTLWSWHAVEETEHKAVAFDVYLAAGGKYWRRRCTTCATTASCTSRAPGPGQSACGSAGAGWPGTCWAPRCVTCRRASILGSTTTASWSRRGWKATLGPIARCARRHQAA